jgi:hypothetical protein
MKDLEAITEAGEQWQSRRQLNEEQLARLDQALHLPTVHLPRLFLPELCSNEIDQFAKQLASDL